MEVQCASTWHVFGHFWNPGPLSLTQKRVTMRSPEAAGHGWLMLVYSMPEWESILPFCLFASRSHCSRVLPHHTIWLLSIWWTSCDLTITIATSDRWHLPNETMLKWQWRLPTCFSHFSSAGGHVVGRYCALHVGGCRLEYSSLHTAFLSSDILVWRLPEGRAYVFSL